MAITNTNALLFGPINKIVIQNEFFEYHLNLTELIILVLCVSITHRNGSFTDVGNKRE